MELTKEELKAWWPAFYENLFPDDEIISELRKDISFNHECNAPDSKGTTGRGIIWNGYGSAITVCYSMDDGSLWVTNDEYGSRVNYCPFCGQEALEKIPL